MTRQGTGHGPNGPSPAPVPTAYCHTMTLGKRVGFLHRAVGRIKKRARRLANRKNQSPPLLGYAAGVSPVPITPPSFLVMTPMPAGYWRAVRCQPYPVQGLSRNAGKMAWGGVNPPSLPAFQGAGQVASLTRRSCLPGATGSCVAKYCCIASRSSAPPSCALPWLNTVKLSPPEARNEFIVTR